MRALAPLLISLTLAAAAQAAIDWPRARPGTETATAPYETWPPDQALRMRELHLRFCGNLRIALREQPFPFADDRACIARQEALLPAFCDAQGRSLRRATAACFAAVNTEMRAGLNRLSGPSRRWEAAPLPLPARPTRLDAPLDPAQLFERVEAAIWLVFVDSGLPGGGGAQGSAVAIGSRHLLTNCHVVRRGDSIQLLRGRERLPARISGAHLESDRCLLQVAEPVLRPVPGLRPARELRVGERVYAIGAPRGLELTLSEGLVSALRQGPGLDVVQNTAPTSPGSSGGGLFDARGNLIGITTAGVGRSESLNFALSADAFWNVATGQQQSLTSD